MFKEAGLIEKYGSGIKRIRDTFFRSTGQYPAFEEIGEGFRVTVYSATPPQKNVVEKKERAILELIRKNKTLSAAQIARTLHITERTAQRYLKNLQERKIIRRIGSDKGGHWERIG